jgi:hypothetical protein
MSLRLFLQTNFKRCLQEKSKGFVGTSAQISILIRLTNGGEGEAMGMVRFQDFHCTGRNQDAIAFHM